MDSEKKSINFQVGNNKAILSLEISDALDL